MLVIMLMGTVCFRLSMCVGVRVRVDVRVSGDVNGLRDSGMRHLLFGGEDGHDESA